MTSLAETFEKAIPDILREWEKSARAALPAARNESRPVLLDRIPEFLKELASALQSPERSAAKPRSAAEHGQQRAERTDYSLEQVVREYSLLRVAILDVLQPLDLPVRAILDFIDLAVAEATTQYVTAQSAALRESEERFRLLVASVQDYAILMLDPEGRVTTWNQGAERITGFAASEIQGCPVSVFYPEAQRTEGAPARELEAAARDERSEAEGLRVRKDGTTFVANVIMTAVRDSDGALSGFSAVMRDITERRAMEAELDRHTEALIEANHRKDEFLAMLGHELRNPLAPIVASVTMLQRQGNQDPAARRAIEIIDRQARHLTRLVDDLLDIARITQGKMGLHKEPLDLIRVLTQVTEAVRPFVADRRQTLSLSLPSESIWMEADPTRLSQAFGNLLHNSIKFTDQGGQISMHAWVKDSSVWVEVRDSGAGIDAQSLPRIFDMFIQGEQPVDRLVTGLGVGLALVRTVVEMHEGSVSAFSEGRGKGSRFLVRLPIQDVEIRSALAPSVHAGPSVSTRVLLVDDNVDAAESVAELLKLCGHTVRVVHNGRDALEAAAAEAPDVVLLDIGLPEMDGYEVARAMRARSDLKSIRLIALSGFGREEDKRRSREAGFDAHLVKPADLESLQAAIDGAERTH